LYQEILLYNTFPLLVSESARPGAVEDPSKGETRFISYRSFKILFLYKLKLVKMSNGENANIKIDFSEKRRQVCAFVTQRRQQQIENDNQDVEDDVDSDNEDDVDSDDECINGDDGDESVDEDAATLWAHRGKSFTDDDDLSLVCRPAERKKKKTILSEPYPTTRKVDLSKTFLSQCAHLDEDEMQFLSMLKSLVAPFFNRPNKQQELHNAMCIPEKEGDLKDIDLLEFVTILNLPRVTVYVVKIIFSHCFSTPEDALPYFRRRDSQGNTLIHELVSYHGNTAVNALRSLLNFRFRKNVCFVFDPQAVNLKGQHAIHLAMEKPLFQSELFDIFNELNCGILKMADYSGNTLLHYMMLQSGNICSNVEVDGKATHMQNYAHKLLSYKEIQVCIPMRNMKGETPQDLLASIDPAIANVIQDEINKFNLEKMLKEVENVSDQPPDDIFDEECLTHNSQYVIDQPMNLRWICTFLEDTNCHATFETQSEFNMHMIEYHGVDPQQDVMAGTGDLPPLMDFGGLLTLDEVQDFNFAD
jgi:hypothetical protein